MKKLKLNLQSLNAEALTRSQLKQILGGEDGGSGGSGGGTRCAIYCCTGPGNCIFERSYYMGCSSNEGCQSWAVENGASCSGGYYVAALCKG